MHRGLKMTPEEALIESNREKVLLNSEKYKREFKRNRRRLQNFKDGQKVLIKNENKSNKMEDTFKENGIVLRKISKSEYEIEVGKGKVIRRHARQLRAFEDRDVVAAR